MNKLLAISLILFSVGASASLGWTHIDDSASGRRFFIDFTTLKTHEGLVYYWQLVDHPKPTGKLNALSHVSYKRVNCTTLETQALFDFFYSEQMGNGSLITEFIQPETEWRETTENSVGQFVTQTACEYKT